MNAPIPSYFHFGATWRRVTEQQRLSARMHDPLTVFVEALQRQDECIALGDAETGNTYAEEYVAAGRELLAGGETSIEHFSSLLRHDDPSVRVAAAAFLLKDRTEQAVAALTPIARAQGQVALEAKCILKRHESGDLQLY